MSTFPTMKINLCKCAIMLLILNGKPLYQILSGLMWLQLMVAFIWTSLPFLLKVWTGSIGWIKYLIYLPIQIFKKASNPRLSFHTLHFIKIQVKLAILKAVLPIGYQDTKLGFLRPKRTQLSFKNGVSPIKNTSNYQCHKTENNKLKKDTS